MILAQLPTEHELFTVVRVKVLMTLSRSQSQHNTVDVDSCLSESDHHHHFANSGAAEILHFFTSENPAAAAERNEV